MYGLHEPTLSRGRICAISGLPASTVNNWNAKAALPLYKHQSPGPGKQRLYTRGEAIACSIVAELDRIGADRNWTPVYAAFALGWIEEHEGGAPMKRLGDDLVAIIKTPFPMLKSNLNSVQSFDLYGELLNADDALAHLSSMLPSFPATTLPFGFVVNRTNEEISRLLGGAE